MLIQLDATRVMLDSVRSNYVKPRWGLSTNTWKTWHKVSQFLQPTKKPTLLKRTNWQRSPKQTVRDRVFSPLPPRENLCRAYRRFEWRWIRWRRGERAGGRRQRRSCLCWGPHEWLPSYPSVSGSESRRRRRSGATERLWKVGPWRKEVVKRMWMGERVDWRRGRRSPW